MSKNILLKLAKLCQMAYLTEDQVDRKLGSPSFWFDIHNSQGFISSDEEGIYIVFRGSSEMADWNDDLMVDLVAHPKFKGKVHKGFSERVLALENVLITLLDNMFYPERNFPVFVTGHSLGGALAVLTREVLEGNGWNIHRTVTFGQPSVGDVEHAFNLPKSLFRVVNGKDLIPGLPTYPYVHGGRGIYLPVSGGNTPLVDKLVETLFGAVDEHRIEAYVRRLKRADAVKLGLEI